jgi:hypothetical protein
MFGGQGGFGGYGNNQFGGGIGEMASDWAINQFVPGGLNSKFRNIRFFFSSKSMFSIKVQWACLLII